MSAFNYGDNVCSQGMSKRIYDQWVADSRSAFSGPNGTAMTGAQTDVLKSLAWGVAKGIKDEIQNQAWTDFTLLNSWVSYDGGTSFAIPGYCLDIGGIVHFRGLIKSGSFSNSLPIAVLPVGFRPSKSLIITGMQDDMLGELRIDAATGNVLAFAVTDVRETNNVGSIVRTTQLVNPSGWFRLDAFSFKLF